MGHNEQTEAETSVSHNSDLQFAMSACLEHIYKEVRSNLLDAKLTLSPTEVSVRLDRNYICEIIFYFLSWEIVSNPYTPFTLQAVSHVVTCVWCNVSVLGSLPDVCVRPCWSAWRFHACEYEFLTVATEGVVHSVNKFVI